MGTPSTPEIRERLSGTEWSVFVGSLHAHYDTGDFADGVEFVRRIGEAADAAGHHPDVDLRYGYVAVVLLSHDVSAVTEKDLALAEQISTIAAELGIRRAPDAPQVLEIAVDAMDIPAVRPFWKAALGYEDGKGRLDDDGRLIDPRGRGPMVWFQQMDVSRADRNRIHFDITVSDAQAPIRIEAVLAAGGHLASDHAAPRFWVLADPEGNEVCICTSEGRD